MTRPSFGGGRARPLPLVVLWTVLLAAPARAATASIFSYAPSNAAERFVAEELKGGRLPDLAERFADPNQRVISARLLHLILTEEPTAESARHYAHGVKGAVVREAVRGHGIRVTRDVILEECVFEGLVDFSAARFEGALFLERTTFRGPVDFIDAEVQGDLQLRRASFETGESDFNSIHVGGNLDIRDAVFMGPAYFAFSKIGGRLVGSRARFEDPNIGADFQEAEVRFNIEFAHAESQGVVNFSGIEVKGIFELGQSRFTQLLQRAASTGGEMPPLKRPRRLRTVRRLNLSFASVEKGLSVSHVDAEEITLNYATVGGPAEIGGLRSGLTDLRFASFRSLIIGDPADHERIHLGGTTYECLATQVCGSLSETTESDLLFGLLRRSPFTRQQYAQLEQYLESYGHTELGDRAYVEMMLRERRERLARLFEDSPSRWLSLDTVVEVPALLLDLCKQYLFGYGRRPELGLIWSAAFVLTGFVVFSPRVMLPKEPGGAPVRYNRVWYSLDLFLPILDLGFDRYWVTAEGRWLRRNYGRVHLIAGWVLIPGSIASISGLIG